MGSCRNHVVIRPVPVLFAAVALAGAASAQDSSKLPHFEAASVKPSTIDETGSRNDMTGVNVVFRNYVLRAVIMSAFGVNQLTLEAPAWLGDERFNITARVSDPNATPEQRRQMLQALLIDRFGLTFHRETKVRAGYALVVARGGPKLQPVPDGDHNNNNRPGRMERTRTTTEDFGTTLGFVLRQPVVNETHMEGRYNILLTYAPEGGADGPSPVSEGPSIFTAVEEQLGLKLEPRKLPVEIFVVDHCEKSPTQN